MLKYCHRILTELQEHCHLFRQDYHFDEGAGGWLKFNPIPVTWDEAVLSCLNDEAMLASPLDKELVKALSAIMACHEVTTTPMFTGISNVYANSEYQTIEGIPISNLCIPWSSPLYKENMLNQSCIAMKADGTLSAVSCSEPHPFACYKKAGIEQGKCGPVNNGFKFDDRTGSCYKAVNREVTWSEGFMICARAGAHLAVANSEIEAQVIWELGKGLFNKTEDLLWKSINIGFRAWGEPRTWMTIHGQSLVNAGYAKWAPGEPSKTHERCGSVRVLSDDYKSGLLNDEDCSHQKKFICEMEVKNETADSTVQIVSTSFLTRPLGGAKVLHGRYNPNV
ncbi:hypothetical protein ABMA28_014666 [Loxostege sticticalis]|uniref:C-type lectin domain-containing protein n=1 Tax=Loxostege sticticalis TaxID=481309 RepID=A0ABD0TDE3_LOXSC